MGEEDHGFEKTREALAASMDTSIRPIKAARRAPEVYDFLWKSLQEMMNGDISPADAMNEVAEFANSLDYSFSAMRGRLTKARHYSALPFILPGRRSQHVP